jgi:hypothetical protein
MLTAPDIKVTLQARRAQLERDLNNQLGTALILVQRAKDAKTQVSATQGAIAEVDAILAQINAPETP